MQRYKDEFQYVGCTTAFSENGETTVWQPDGTQMTVQHESGAYAERLVGVGLLMPSLFIEDPTVIGVLIEPNVDLHGFRFRMRGGGMSKSEQLHTYDPSAIGSNGEKVINLANLFDDLTVKPSGWTMWSRPLTFEDVNYPSSNGGVTLVYNREESPNYWMDMAGVTDLESFFAKLVTTSGFTGGVVEYANFG